MQRKKLAVVLAVVVSLALVGGTAGTAAAGQVGSDACIPAYSVGEDVDSTDDGVSANGCVNDGGGSGGDGKP